MMNKEHLENKIWYRTLKVLFFGCFILVQLLSFYITFSVTSSTKEFVKCNNGTEFENPFPGFDFTNSINESGVVATARTEIINRLINRCIIKMTRAEYKAKYGIEPDVPLKTSQDTNLSLREQAIQELERRDSLTGTPIQFVPDKLPYSRYEKARYAPIERVAFLLGSIVIVSFVFWFVAKIFFYIILGDKLFSLKKRNGNQN